MFWRNKSVPKIGYAHQAKYFGIPFHCKEAVYMNKDIAHQGFTQFALREATYRVRSCS